MSDTFLKSRRILNIAHRGASSVAPQNTLAAFEKAFELGADGIEFDVRLSADGVPVIIHDATVDSTTDGSGRVTDMTLVELKQLDAGSSFDPAFAGERIPTLSELLATVGESLLLNVELKSRSVFGGALARAVVDRIEQYGLEERVVISSFNPLALRRVQRQAPDIPTGLLSMQSAQIVPNLAQALSPSSYAALHPHHTLVNETYIRWAHQHGYRVHVWTVDDVVDMRRFVAWGMDGIITNRPDSLRDILQAAA